MGTSKRFAQPAVATPEQAATSLAICRTKVYELLRNGEIESVQIGASQRSPAVTLAEYVQRLRDGTGRSTDTSEPNQTVHRQTSAG